MTKDAFLNDQMPSWELDQVQNMTKAWVYIVRLDTGPNDLSMYNHSFIFIAGDYISLCKANTADHYPNSFRLQFPQSQYNSTNSCMV